MPEPPARRLLRHWRALAPPGRRLGPAVCGVVAADLQTRTAIYAPEPLAGACARARVRVCLCARVRVCVCVCVLVCARACLRACVRPCVLVPATVWAGICLLPCGWSRAHVRPDGLRLCVSCGRWAGCCRLRGCSWGGVSGAGGLCHGLCCRSCGCVGQEGGPEGLVAPPDSSSGPADAAAGVPSHEPTTNITYAVGTSCSLIRKNNAGVLATLSAERHALPPPLLDAAAEQFAAHALTHGSGAAAARFLAAVGAQLRLQQQAAAAGEAAVAAAVAAVAEGPAPGGAQWLEQHPRLLLACLELMTRVGVAACVVTRAHA